MIREYPEGKSFGSSPGFCVPVVADIFFFANRTSEKYLLSYLTEKRYDSFNKFFYDTVSD